MCITISQQEERKHKGNMVIIMFIAFTMAITFLASIIEVSQNQSRTAQKRSLPLLETEPQTTIGRQMHQQLYKGLDKSLGLDHKGVIAGR